MSKQHASKLDQYAATLLDLDDQHKTLEDMVAWLRAEGVTASTGRVSGFLSDLRQQRLQARLLGQIASGARQCADVEKQFGKNPAPALETLIKLQRVLILQLSTQANVDPSLMETIFFAFKSVMDSEKVKLKREELGLARDKFQFDAAEAALKHAAELKVMSVSKLSEADKVNAARKKLFGVEGT